MVNQFISVIFGMIIACPCPTLTLSLAKKTDVSVHEVMHHKFLEDLFHIPLSQEAFAEFLLEDLCLSTQGLMDPLASNTWSYIWGSQHFSSKKAYSVLTGNQPTRPHFSWIWKSSCQSKHKLFFWLLLRDRLKTRNLLARKNFQLQNYDCETSQCHQEETIVHLFWSCPFAPRCWEFICPDRFPSLDWVEAVVDLKMKLQVPFYMEIIILTAWGLWMVRNNKIFNNHRPPFQSWKAIYYHELTLVSHRVRNKYAQQFKDWLEHRTQVFLEFFYIYYLDHLIQFLYIRLYL
jgi:hypothetical protein